MLFDPARKLPDPWLSTIRALLFVALGFFLGGLCIGDFSALREPFADSVIRLSVVTAAVSFPLRYWLRPSPSPSAHQEGGIAFIVLVALMCGWWISSTHMADTGHGNIWDTIAGDHTVRTQLILCGGSFILLIRFRVIVDLGEHKGRWAAALLFFLAAQFVMIGDTDYQLAQCAIDLDTWKGWRMINSALIIPTIIGALAVIHGASLRAICVIGSIGIVALYLFIILGEPDVVPKP